MLVSSYTECTLLFGTQEVSANHAQAVGFSNDGFATSPLMRERGMIWVTTRMHIEMFKYPKW
jgi:fatty acyl-ACP thioesterase A